MQTSIVCTKIPYDFKLLNTCNELLSGNSSLTEILRPEPTAIEVPFPGVLRSQPDHLSSNPRAAAPTAHLKDPVADESLRFLNHR
jgi:hypothetical protein